MDTATKPTRREERRIQTVREIKDLAMRQVAEGGPEAVSLSGIVREMSMSPAAVYRYFDSRDDLLADLVVDAYDALADSLVALEDASDSPEAHLDAVLRGTWTWALQNPNAYRLIFQTSIGSGNDFAAERTIPASSRSMTVIVRAIAAMAEGGASSERPGSTALTAALGEWRERNGVDDVSVEVLALGFLSWTRLHGVISLELGGHLAATGIGAEVLFEAEVVGIREAAGAV